MTKVLFVDDDIDLCTAFQSYLGKKGLDVTVAHNGKVAHKMVYETKPDLIILDIQMGNTDGFQLATKLRKEGCIIPIIFFSGLQDSQFVVKGFDLGADDYIKKPVDPEELYARIKSKIKDEFILGEYAFNSNTCELRYKNGAITTLTLIQSQILKCLCRNIGKTLSRESIFLTIWGTDTATSRTIDSHISKIRKCFHENSGVEIIRDYASGYRLVIKQV